MRRCNLYLGFILAHVSSWAFAQPSPSNQFSQPRLEAQSPFSRVWTLPDTPDGLRPNQSWFSVGAAPDGTMFVSGCDHLSNSALYSLAPGESSPVYRGDARAASLAAGNWLAGETAEKFHVRPLIYKGRAYLATADYSNQDEGYLQRRGFHWYSYDLRTQEFLDLSAKEPGGVAAAHISIFSTALDESRGLIYGLGSPTAHLYQYNIATGQTTDLGRPPELTRKFYNPGRLMWVDSRGRVYFTVGTAGTLAPGEPKTPAYVLSWDPAAGWVSRPDWPVSEMLRIGQWSLDKKRFYALDYPLRLYVFDDEAQTFTSLGQGLLDEDHVSPRTKNVRVRSMNLSPSEQKIYFVNDSAKVNSLFEWNFRESMIPRELLRVEAIDSRLDSRYTAFTGHDSWDAEGQFYLTGFGGEGVPATPDVYFMGINPVRLKASLGYLAGIPFIQLNQKSPVPSLTRQGDLSRDLKVIIRIEGPGQQPARFEKVDFPAGVRELPLAFIRQLPVQPGSHGISLVADGDTYLVGSKD